MEQRLRPVNGLMALCIPGDVHQPVLHEAGFEVAGLEVPVLTPEGKVVVDVLLVHRAAAHLIACESKSGANVEPEQAKAYAALDPQAVRIAGSVSLPTREPPTVEPLFVCLKRQAARIRTGLQRVGIRCPVLMVEGKSVDLAGRELASERLASAIPQGGVVLPAGIPEHVRFDDHTPVDDLRGTVRAQLATLQSRKIPQLSIPALAEQAIPGLAIYGKGARMRLIRKVGEAVQSIVVEESDAFAYQRRTGTHDPIVRVLKTPEDNDPRGRTQAWQASGRPRQGARRRGAPSPDQLDLLQELDSADSVGGEDNDEGPERGVDQ